MSTSNPGLLNEKQIGCDSDGDAIKLHNSRRPALRGTRTRCLKDENCRKEMQAARVGCQVMLHYPNRKRVRGG